MPKDDENYIRNLEEASEHTHLKIWEQKIKDATSKIDNSIKLLETGKVITAKNEIREAYDLLIEEIFFFKDPEDGEDVFQSSTKPDFQKILSRKKFSDQESQLLSKMIESYHTTDKEEIRLINLIKHKI